MTRDYFFHDNPQLFSWPFMNSEPRDLSPARARNLTEIH
ncbi:MAG: hypothetical protein Sylvanvirus25_12, partial [Sylvanvirus sp.]